MKNTEWRIMSVIGVIASGFSAEAFSLHRWVAGAVLAYVAFIDGVAVAIATAMPDREKEPK